MCVCVWLKPLQASSTPSWSFRPGVPAVRPERGATLTPGAGRPHTSLQTLCSAVCGLTSDVLVFWLDVPNQDLINSCFELSCHVSGVFAFIPFVSHDVGIWKKAELVLRADPVCLIGSLRCFFVSLPLCISLN